MRNVKGSAGYRRIKSLPLYSLAPLTFGGGESKYYQEHLSRRRYWHRSGIECDAEESWFFVPNAKLIWMWKKKKSTKARSSPAPSAARISKWSPPVRSN